MRLLNIESSPRGPRSASIAVTSAFLEAYRQACPGVMVDTLNVWEEKLPDFDQEAIGAKYKGVNKEPMDQAETAVWDKIQELAVRFQQADRIVLGVPMWNMEDYSRRRGAFAAKARELGLHSVAGAPIIVDGAVWGLVTIASTDGPLPDRTEDRLAEFTELLGTAIANTQSRAELSASRARIVAAADETRRRLERDLHDGIQQRLVSLALKARTIETMTPRPADEIRGELSQLAEGLGTALDELREISHGIHPAILSEAGLGPALEALARRSAVPVELDLNLGPRLGEHVEAAGYYIASEALANVAKHAQASVIDMRADSCDGALILSIRDDGVGGADPSRGSGLIGLTDRVAALGGTISVLSPPGRGTTLHVQLPADPMAAPTLPGGTP